MIKFCNYCSFKNSCDAETAAEQYECVAAYIDTLEDSLTDILGRLRHLKKTGCVDVLTKNCIELTAQEMLNIVNLP